MAPININKVSLLVMGIILPHSNCVLFQPPTYYEANRTNDIWMTCWQPDGIMGDLPELGSNFASCFKHRMYQNLVTYVDQQCVDIGDGVTFLSNGDAVLSARDLFPLGEEPSSYRALADAYSTFLSRRGIRWDLGHLYPGLIMRVGPTISGDGILEFVMDRRLDHYDRAKLGPGQQMIRRTVLPHLLSFRMNLLTFLPLIFGVLIFVAKNAFIFSKISLVISTLLALKSLFVLQHLRPPHPYDALDASDSLATIGGPKLTKPLSHIHPENLVLQMFSGAVPPFRGVNDKQFEDQARGVRNFAWEK